MSPRALGAWIGLGIVAVVSAGVWLARPPEAPSGAAPPVSTRAPTLPERADGSSSRGEPASRPTARAEAPAPSEAEPASETPDDPDFESALRWSLVDLESVREALPDNLYWEMSVPTTDADVLAWREQERARWNREYGKVLSGTASEQEIADYFALRRRISEDAVEFSAYLRANFGSVLPERDLGLLALASRLHRARLEEMPRRMAEAMERKQEQDRLRAAWLEDEAAFGSVPGDATPATAAD